jgi:hypothetical protein
VAQTWGHTDMGSGLAFCGTDMGSGLAFCVKISLRAHCVRRPGDDETGLTEIPQRARHPGSCLVRSGQRQHRMGSDRVLARRAWLSCSRGCRIVGYLRMARAASHVPSSAP